MGLMMEAASLFLVVVMVIPAARGLWLDLPSSGSKCVYEELRSNVVVLGDYYSFFGEDDNVNNTVTPSISVKVTSPYGTDLYHQEKVSYGQFAFTASEAGSYMACFTSTGDHHGRKTLTVGIDWKVGIAAKDWDSVARKQHIEGLELELAKLEGVVQDIHENLVDLVSREVGMREVSETTNARVVRYSAMSLGVCIVAGIFQLWYLRRYFQKKKLI